MTVPVRPEPAASLLRRLGWLHRKVVCRDNDGRRSALHLRRRTPETVEIEFPGGGIARLTNVEAGRLRAALRDVLLDEHPPHQAEDARSRRARRQQAAAFASRATCTRSADRNRAEADGDTRPRPCPSPTLRSTGS
jgi:hypothetical protein